MRFDVCSAGCHEDLAAGWHGDRALDPFSEVVGAAGG